ncbi:MAG: DEAD/DEAH box helicase [Halobacteriales archaeon]
MTDGDVAAFAELGAPVRAALSARGFDRPTRPQRLAIPPIAARAHTLVVAPTGTGKTEAAMLPIFDHLVAAGARTGIGALYVTPLRALNRDMLERLEWWGDQLDLDVQVRHGDTGDYRRRKQATDPPDVLITTPETVQAMLTGSRLREALADVAHVVVDEVHELAASKRGAQLSVALERLVDLAGSFQRVGLSATVGEPRTVARFLGGRDREVTVRQLDVGGDLEVSVRLPEPTEADEALADRLLVDPTMARQVREIVDLVEAHDSTLVFVNTRQTAEALGSRFAALEANIGVHHGSLSKAARLEVEDAFKAGELDGLVCTSSMELGIDVGHVDHVVQYGSPRQVTRLVQRVGRAGHAAGRTSRGTIVATDPDDALESVVIARRAGEGRIEPVDLHEGSLDTVANQLAAMTHSRDGVDLEVAHATLRRAYPFRDLGLDRVSAVVEELARNGVVWWDEDARRLETTGRTWRYVYDNLSMIPDEATYEVTDVASGGPVGTLDERFVVGFAEPGATFIQGGEMWRVVAVEDDAVQVAPVEDPTGEVPSWVGEEIPVPRAVAQDVGRLRGDVETALTGGPVGDPEAALADLAEASGVDRLTLSRAAADVVDQLEAGQPVPTHEHLLVDETDEGVVVNVCGGHQVNETLGRLLSALLGQRTGSTVGLEADPYRVTLTLPAALDGRAVVEQLRSVDPDHVEPLLELSLKGSQEVGYRLAHVGKKFGAIEDVRGEGPTASWRRLVRFFEDTPLFDEAVREIFHDDLDPAGASALLDDLAEGVVTLEVVRGPTPLSTAGRTAGSELLRPERADASVVDTVHERLLETELRLVCLHCREYDATRRVGGLPDQPRCPRCESTRLAVVSPWADELVAALDDPEAPERDRERLYRSASLVQSHGRRAVVALAGRGVGPQTAARIINHHREDERDFVRDILEAEREYARTRSFWD